MLTGSDFVVANLDNILIKNESQSHLAEHRLKGYGFRLSKEKCEFFNAKNKISKAGNNMVGIFNFGCTRPTFIVYQSFLCFML